MVIELYFIRGITMADTPLFDTKAKQETYFANHKVTTINTGYYPPYYYNLIKLETSDCSLTTKANYLSINDGSKTYYYFINNVTYINEDVYQLEIEMDTIQTYLFDMEINSCQIERKFINRFIDYTKHEFNRNYIRENVSNGVFIPYTQKDFTPSNNLCWFIIRTAEKQGNIKVKYISATPYTSNVTEITSSYCYYFVPYMKGAVSYVMQTKGESITHIGNIDTILNNLTRDAKTIDIQFAPYNIFADDVLDSFSLGGSTNDTLYVTFKSNKKVSYKSITETVTSSIMYFDNWGTQTPVSFSANIVSNSQTIYTFYLPTSKGVEFNKRFAPVLFDNNYISVGFGEDNNYASIDCYQYLSSNFTLAYENSPLMIRMYWLDNPDIIGGTSNKVFYTQAYVVATEPFYCDAINDSWNTWKSKNTFSGITAVMNDAYNYGKNIIGISNANDLIGKSLRAQMNVTNTRWRRAITGTYTDPQESGITEHTPFTRLIGGGDINVRLMNTQRDRENELSRANANKQISANNMRMADFPTTALGVANDALNARFAPSTAKNMGDYGNSLVAGKGVVNLIVKEVNDMEQCAWYFHKNGYLVNEEYSRLTTDAVDYDYLFYYVNTRYYYNILKCTDINLDLKDCLNNVTSINNIRERLEMGLRLWNVENSDVTIGDFRFDNIEKSYIQ